MSKPLPGFIFAVLLCVFITRAALAAPMKVTAAKVQGAVQVKSGSAWKAVKDGDTLPEGADVKTGANSSCLLKWAGGNVVKVGPMSVVSVEAQKNGADEKSTVSLKDGKVNAHAKKLTSNNSSYQVKTPTAVAGVRGTDIFAEVSPEGSNFGVSDGNLEMNIGGETFPLDDGYMVDVNEDGSFTEPAPMPEEMLQEMKSEFESIKEEARADEHASDKGAENSADKKDKDDKDEKAEEKEDKDKSDDGVKSEARSDDKEAGEGDTDGEGDVGEAAASEDDSLDTGDAGEELDIADVTDIIDTVLDNEIINDVVDAAGTEYINGEVEVLIYLDPASAP